MGRRGESIYQRRDGRWEARYPLGKGKNGVTKYRSVYGKTYSEAKEKRRRAMQSGYTPKSKECFSAVIEQWMLEKEHEVKEQTLRRYRQCIDAHIRPYFGHMRNTAISATLVEKFLSEKKKNGRLDGKGGLSQNTIRSMGIILQSLLDFAYQKEMGIVKQIRIKKPKSERKQVCVLRSYEQRILEKALHDEPHGENLAIYLALYTGMRIGEVCALRWDDVDLIEKQLHVRATVIRDKSGASVIGKPKSETSDRFIPITGRLSGLLAQEKSMSASPFVFTAPKQGDFLNPRTLQYRFKAILKKCGLPIITFHALRHTFATRWLECGMDIKSLSEVLGHASVQITLDIYVHSSDKLKRDAIEQIEKISGQNSGQQNTESVA